MSGQYVRELFSLCSVCASLLQLHESHFLSKLCLDLSLQQYLLRGLCLSCGNFCQPDCPHLRPLPCELFHLRHSRQQLYFMCFPLLQLQRDMREHVSVWTVSERFSLLELRFSMCHMHKFHLLFKLFSQLLHKQHLRYCFAVSYRNFSKPNC